MGDPPASGECSGLLFAVLAGEGSQSLVLLGESLEATVTVLGGSVNELDLGLLGHPGLRRWENRLAHHDWSLAGPLNGALKQKEVVVDLTVVWEAAHRGDVLLNGIVVASSVVFHTTFGASTNAEDFGVDMSSVMVATLTMAGHCPLHGSWMPGTDTSNLPQASVSLAGQPCDTKSLDDTLQSVTPGHTNCVTAIVLLEDLANFDFLFKVFEGPVNLCGNVATVNLNLHDMSLVLAELEKTNLGGNKHANHRAVLLDALEVTLD